MELDGGLDKQMPCRRGKSTHDLGPLSESHAFGGSAMTWRHLQSIGAPRAYVQKVLGLLREPVRMGGRVEEGHERSVLL